MTLQEMLDESKKVVFFGGAGVSTESGIPDFRSVDGLYHEKYDYPPETILSHTFFTENPKEFYRYYRDKLLPEGILPNAAHRFLARLEQVGKLTGIVTQNIDGLHQAAGSKKVYELHGSIHRNYCTKCGAFYDAEYIKTHTPLPLCTCGGLIKPDVVLYEEMLDDDTVEGAVRAISEADMMMIAGTSLAVYPAAGLVHYFNGKHLVLINWDETPMDGKADLVLHEKVGEVLGAIHIR